MGVTGRMRLVAQPGGLTSAIALRLVFHYFCSNNTPLVTGNKHTDVYYAYTPVQGVITFVRLGRCFRFV